MSDQTHHTTGASPSQGDIAEVTLRRVEAGEYLQECVDLMVRSDPWKTLGITESLAKTVIDGPDTERYVAMFRDNMVGFITLQLTGGLRGYIRDIAIHPHWRGAGLGSRLLHAAEERIFRDTRNVFLCVSAFNTRARQLYHRRGYVTVGILHDYLITGSDEILMRKTRGPFLDG